MSAKHNLQEEYKKAREKYNLPDFKKLNNEFELSSAKNVDKEFLLRLVRRKIIEKVVFFCRVLGGVLHPTNGSIIGMYENKFFDEGERTKISNLLKELMLIERQSLILDIQPNDKKEVEFINHVFDKWNGIKDELLKISEKMRDSWRTEQKSDVEDYFG